MKVSSVPFLVLITLIPASVFAVNNQYVDGRAFDVDKIEPSSPGCDDFCPIVMDVATGKTKNLNGEAGGWAEADDQWCANHAVGTNPAVLPKTPTGTAPTASCNVPLLAGDGSCSEVNRRLQHCKLRGSQLETQCAAYVAQKDATKGEKVVLALDTVAASTCGLACAGGVIPGAQAALVTACNYAGATAGAAQFIQTLKSKSSTVQKYIGAGTGALGAGMGVAGILGKTPMETTTGASVFSVTKGSGDGAVNIDIAKGTDGKWLMANGDPITDPAITSKIEANDIHEVKGETTESPSKKGNSCKAAIVFGAMTGLRVFNMKRNADNKKKACQQVKELVNSALAAGFKPLAGTTANAGNTSSSSSNSGGTTSSQSNGNSSVTTANRPPNTLLGGTGVGDYAQCLADPKCTNSKLSGQENQSAASDTELLKGFGNALNRAAAQLPLDELEKTLERGGSADGFLNSAFGGGGSVGAAMAGLAKAMEKDASAGSLSTDLAGMTTPTRGMASAPQAKAAEENPFKLMGGDMGQVTPSATGFDQPQLMSSGPACDASDIWHSNCQGDPSIFQIVSGKINQSHDRVDRLGWALPMNRRIAGGK